jgi:outer membrane protein OmpA-like peptidoglycan-associated protein
VGLGEGNPTINAVPCSTGDSATSALKACLRRDRRVEIEVSATK